MSPDAIAQIVALVAECGAEFEVSLKAEWDAPMATNRCGYSRQTTGRCHGISDIEDWLKRP